MEELSAAGGCGLEGAQDRRQGLGSVTSQHVAVLKLRITNPRDDLMPLVIGRSLKLSCPFIVGLAGGQGGRAWGRGPGGSVGVMGGSAWPL